MCVGVGDLPPQELDLLADGPVTLDPSQTTAVRQVYVYVCVGGVGGGGPSGAHLPPGVCVCVCGGGGSTGPHLPPGGVCVVMGWGGATGPYLPAGGVCALWFLKWWSGVDG